MKDYNKIKVSRVDTYFQIELSHPPLNIIDFEMMSELSDALDNANSASFLILSSSLQHFSAGVDVKIHTPDQVPEMLDRFHKVIRKLYHYPGITISAIHGHALGGGMELALCCDVILADRNSSIGFPEITLACFPPVAAILLPRSAQWLLFSGESITAQRAYELGIINQLYEDESELKKIIDGFKSLSADAVRSLKSAIRKTSSFDFDQALAEAERVYKEELLKSPDGLEAVKSFLEKRPPKF
ncbi:enoyl-CoA hydratase/isomerase family protein [bacterium]|nr:enoyl-CoA hydratase/isomerase family protein [bacterium]